MTTSALTPCRARAIITPTGLEPTEVACAYFDVGEDLHEGEHQFLIAWLGGMLPLTDVRRDPDVRTFIPVNSSPTSPRFRVAADSGPADPESAGVGPLISGSDEMIDGLVSAREQAEAAGLEWRPDPLVVSLDPDTTAVVVLEVSPAIAALDDVLAELEQLHSNLEDDDQAVTVLTAMSLLRRYRRLLTA